MGLTKTIRLFKPQSATRLQDEDRQDSFEEYDAEQSSRRVSAYLDEEPRGYNFTPVDQKMIEDKDDEQHLASLALLLLHKEPHISRNPTASLSSRDTSTSTLSSSSRSSSPDSFTLASDESAHAGASMMVFADNIKNEPKENAKVHLLSVEDLSDMPESEEDEERQDDEIAKLQTWRINRVDSIIMDNREDHGGDSSTMADDDTVPKILAIDHGRKKVTIDPVVVFDAHYEFAPEKLRERHQAKEPYRMEDVSKPDASRPAAKVVWSKKVLHKLRKQRGKKRWSGFGSGKLSVVMEELTSFDDNEY